MPVQLDSVTVKDQVTAMCLPFFPVLKFILFLLHCYLREGEGQITCLLVHRALDSEDPSTRRPSEILGSQLELCPDGTLPCLPLKGAKCALCEGWPGGGLWQSNIYSPLLLPLLVIPHNFNERIIFPSFLCR